MIRKKLFLYFLFLIIIAVVFSGVFASRLIIKHYKDDIKSNLINNIYILKYQYENYNTNENDFNYLANTYSKLLNNKEHRVTFIAEDGTVLGDSSVDYLKMESHFYRPEIQTAIKEGFGTDLRESTTIGTEFFYAAVLMDNNIILRICVPVENINDISNSMWIYTLFGMLFGSALAAIVAIRLSLNISKPVAQLTYAAEEISKGNYKKRIPLDRKDEFGKLSQTFNKMAYNLGNNIKNLSEKNIHMKAVLSSMNDGLAAVDKNLNIILINKALRKMLSITGKAEKKPLVDIIRSTRLINALNKTVLNGSTNSFEINFNIYDKKILRISTSPIVENKSSGHQSRSLLKTGSAGISNESNKISGAIVVFSDVTDIRRLEKIRSEFVSNVTHELKTPLTSIKGFIETLKNGAVKDEKSAHKFLDIIDIEAERLHILINDILQLSEIETMQNESDIHEFELSPLVFEVIEILNESAGEKNVALFNKTDNVKMKANRNRIKQLIINLMDNGIKYNKEGGSVTVSAMNEPDFIIIKVKDTGIGITKENTARIFERFYRVDKGRSRSMGGTGLGLSIVKHIVNLYNGSVNVSSTPGKGTEFIIKIPQ